jgi:hypothetical protein
LWFPGQRGSLTIIAVIWTQYPFWSAPGEFIVKLFGRGLGMVASNIITSNRYRPSNDSPGFEQGSLLANVTLPASQSLSFKLATFFFSFAIKHHD